MATTLNALVMKISMDASEVEAGSKQVRSDVSRVNQVFREMETDTDKVVKKIESVVRQFKRGKITAEQYAKAMEYLGDKYDRLNKKTSVLETQLMGFAKSIVPTVNLVDVFRLGVDAGRAALEAFASAAATVRDKMSELDPIIKQSRAMGELTSNVQTLAFALSESAGMSIEETSQSLMELQKRLGEAQLGTGEAANALKILGLNAAELSRLSPVEQFRLVAEELQKVEDATMRAYLADKLFAEQGKKLVNGLTQSNQTLAEAEQAARNFGLALSEVQASRIEAANDALGRVSAQIDGIITQFSAELAPAVQFFATELSSIIPLAGNMRLEFEMLVDTLVASTAIARNFTAGLIDGLIGVGAAGSQIGDAIATDDVATVLEKYHAMRDAAYETADAARKQREEAAAAAMAAGKTQADYQKQVEALEDQINAAMGIDVAFMKQIEARQEMSFLQKEHLRFLDQALAEEKAIAKQKEQAAKAEEKRLADIEALRKRGQDMIEQGDPAKMVEKQIADLGVMLGVLGESFRSTYDREVQKIIKDAAAAKLGNADRPGLIEAGTQAAADVAMQGVFDKQEEQLRLLEEQKLMQQAQLQAQQETNRRLADLGIVGVIR